MELSLSHQKSTSKVLCQTPETSEYTNSRSKSSFIKTIDYMNACTQTAQSPRRSSTASASSVTTFVSTRKSSLTTVPTQGATSHSSRKAIEICTCKRHTLIYVCTSAPTQTVERSLQDDPTCNNTSRLRSRRSRT